MDFFYIWPLTLSLSVFILFAVLGSLFIYLISYWAIRKKLSKSHERTGRTLFRTTASLLALLLSFTFANQRVSYFKIKDSLESEAAHLVDIYLDLQFYDTPETAELLEKEKHYIKSILKEGLDHEKDNPFFTSSESIFISIYHKALDLRPVNDRQAQLKQNILADLDLVSDFMQMRGYRSQAEPLNLIFIASFGFVVSAILFSVYKPDGITIGFLSLYNAFISTVLYFIIMMNNPLLGPLKIQNEPFKILIDIANMN